MVNYWNQIPPLTEKTVTTIKGNSGSSVSLAMLRFIYYNAWAWKTFKIVRTQFDRDTSHMTIKKRISYCEQLFLHFYIDTTKHL